MPTIQPVSPPGGTLLSPGIIFSSSYSSPCTSSHHLSIVLFKGGSRSQHFGLLHPHPLATLMSLLRGCDQEFPGLLHGFPPCHVIVSALKGPNPESPLWDFCPHFHLFVCLFINSSFMRTETLQGFACLPAPSNACNLIFHTCQPTGSWQFSEPILSP